MACGMDIAGGWLTLQQCHDRKVSFLFKDFQVQRATCIDIDRVLKCCPVYSKVTFLKRAEGDVHFVCEAGQEIERAIEEAHRTGKRVNFPVKVRAFVPSKVRPCLTCAV
jgi:hypothetical protein